MSDSFVAYDEAAAKPKDSFVAYDASAPVRRPPRKDSLKGGPADMPEHSPTNEQGFWSSLGSAVTAPWNLAANLDTITPQQVIEGIGSPIMKLGAGNITGALGDVAGAWLTGKVLGGEGPGPPDTRRVTVEPWREGPSGGGGKIPSIVTELLPSPLKWGAKAYNFLGGKQPKPYAVEVPSVERGTPGWQILDKPSIPVPPAVESIPGALPSGRTPGKPGIAPAVEKPYDAEAIVRKVLAEKAREAVPAPPNGELAGTKLPDTEAGLHYGIHAAAKDLWGSSPHEPLRQLVEQRYGKNRTMTFEKNVLPEGKTRLTLKERADLLKHLLTQMPEPPK